jgi:hypothetical protein
MNLVLGTQLRANWGTLTLESAIRDVIGVQGSGDVHVAVCKCEWDVVCVLSDN